MELLEFIHIPSRTWRLNKLSPAKASFPQFPTFFSFSTLFALRCFSASSVASAILVYFLQRPVERETWQMYV